MTEQNYISIWENLMSNFQEGHEKNMTQLFQEHPEFYPDGEGEMLQEKAIDNLNRWDPKKAVEYLLKENPELIGKDLMKLSQKESYNLIVPLVNEELEAITPLNYD